MARADKVAAVAEITDRFRESNAAVLTEYRGLTVAQLTQLRKSIGSNATYSVVKNTLTEIAAKNAGISAFDGRLAGPTAIAFVTGDPVETAKGLRDFARTFPALVIKGGVMDGRSLTADEVRRLADLESREVLLAKLAGAMKASLSKAVHLFAAPLSQAARTIDALRLKAESDPGVLAGGAGTPAAVAEGTPAQVEPATAVTEAPAADGTLAPAAADAPEEAAEPAAAETTEG